jgi:kumamolisin
VRRLLAASSAAVLIAMSVGFTAATAAPTPTVPIAGSFTSAGSAQVVGPHAASASLTITLVLQPGNIGQLNNLLTKLYDPTSNQYHHWLGAGQFAQQFAPAAADVASVTTFLTQAGLTIGASPSPLLIRATGTTGQIEAAFNTSINDYRTASGTAFYQNSGTASVPASLGSIVQGVTGLWNTVRLQPSYITTRAAALAAGKPIPQYGAGPGGSGLTPSQVSGIYDADTVAATGNAGKGAGAKLAVFELSGYTASDVTAYEHQFFGNAENVNIVDVNVDGGPVSPVCPGGDSCGPFGGSCPTGCSSTDYSGDIEVEADIEMQLSLAPKINRILVYNAPNDETGQTELDEYFKIANDDTADSISSSWGLCEPDAGLGVAQAEWDAFAEMALQGQSMFSAAGDTGAFDCLRGSGYPGISVDDPTAQPWVTGVGGTSFGTFDPASKKHPSYPNKAETVWNPLGLCTPSELGDCADFGAGGGGVSIFWQSPSFQHGPGVVSGQSQTAPYCNQTAGPVSASARGQLCREVPDVSADADEFTPYAEFCTGNSTTTGDGQSTCAQFSGGQPAPGWFGIGGTSLSSPLWSSVIALYDAVHNGRFGSASPGLYTLFRSGGAYNSYLHDITGKNQSPNNNGYYFVTPNYDMSTGVGTPRISGIATSP